MFPHIPQQTIIDDLLLTGDVHATCERILSGQVIAPNPPTPPPAEIQGPFTSPTVNYIPSSPVSHPEKTWSSSLDDRQSHLRQRKEFMMQQARQSIFLI